MPLFLVIEHYRSGASAVYARLAERGRMLPDDVRYVDSWVAADRHDTCYQLMVAPGPDALEPWIARWSDLVAFEVVAVVPSAEAAAEAAAGETHEP